MPESGQHIDIERYRMTDGFVFAEHSGMTHETWQDSLWPGHRVRAVEDLWAKHTDAEQPLLAWYDEVSKASWKQPSEIKLHYRAPAF